MNHQNLTSDAQALEGPDCEPINQPLLLSLTNLHIARAIAIVYGEHDFAVRISQDIEAIETSADAAIRASVAANAPGIWNSH